MWKPFDSGMMPSRKEIVVALSAALVLGSWGCSRSDRTDSPVVIRFPQALAETHPRVIAIQRFGTRLEAQTQGRVRVQVFPGGQLYGARQAVNAAAFGDVEMALEPESHFITFDDRFKAIDIPFIFDDVKDFHFFLEGFGSQIQKDLQKKDLVLVALWDEGPMVLASNKKALTHPGDFSGTKIRSSGHEILARSWNEMGAATVSIPIHEVYTALQQGVADAIYTTFNTFVSAKLYEVSPKVVLWPSRAVYVWVVNRDFWNSLPAAEQDIILNLSTDVTREYHEEIWDSYDQLVDTIRSAPNGEFHELDETQLHAFRARIEPLLGAWQSEYSSVLENLN